MAAQLEDAVCIRQWDWSETSQVVSLLTRGMGMVRGVAKGSRRPKSPYSGGIEPLTLGQAGIIVRRNSELALITEWDLAEPWRHIRQDWRVFLAANYLGDLVQHFVRDHDAHPGLFDGLVRAWAGLRPGRAAWPVLVEGMWVVLAEAGFKPSLSVDVRTGEALGASARWVFVPELGGLSVPDGEGDTGGTGGGWGVRAETVELLRRVEARTAAGAADGDGGGGEGAGGAEGSVAERGLAATEAGAGVVAERACRLLGAYARHVLGTEPPTHEALFGRDVGGGARGSEKPR